MALVAPNNHKIMDMKNLESAIQMQKIYLSKTVKEWRILILQFEENHQKNVAQRTYYTLQNFTTCSLTT